MKNKLNLALFSLIVSIFAISPSLAERPKPPGYFFGPIDYSGGQIEPNLSLANLEYLLVEPGDSCGPNGESVYVVNEAGEMICVPKKILPEVPINSVEWLIQTLRQLQKRGR